MPKKVWDLILQDAWNLCLAMIFLLHSTQTTSGACPTSYPMGTRCCSPRSKAAEARRWQLTRIYCQGQGWWNYTSTPPIFLHGIVIKYIIKYNNNFSITLQEAILDVYSNMMIVQFNKRDSWFLWQQTCTQQETNCLKQYFLLGLLQGYIVSTKQTT
jgi:hypothetical protein